MMLVMTRVADNDYSKANDDDHGIDENNNGDSKNIIMMIGKVKMLIMIIMIMTTIKVITILMMMTVQPYYLAYKIIEVETVSAEFICLAIVPFIC